MAILRCNIVTNEVGVKQYVPFAMEDDKKAALINDGVVAFNVFPNDDKVDMRNAPPFLTIIPCPYCGSESEHKHEPLKHVNEKVGVPNKDIEELAKAKNISEKEAYRILWNLKFG
jgi:hypothetical protein